MSISEPLPPPPDGEPDHGHGGAPEGVCGPDRNANGAPGPDRRSDRDAGPKPDFGRAEDVEGAAFFPAGEEWPLPRDEDVPPLEEECPPPPDDEGPSPQDGGSWDSSGELLEAFTAAQRREAREQVRKIQVAVDYCAFNSPDSRHPAARLPGTQGTMTLAGDGTPEVAEFAVVEFGAVAGMSTDAARTYLGRCLEITHRLPHTRQALRAGRLPVWRAFRIADHTLPLSAHAAAWVDAKVARIAARVGPVVLKRIVEETLRALDPDAAKQAATEALEKRHATITLEQAITNLDQHGAGILATGRLDAILDAADALDLDAKLADYAADLATAGDTSPLDVRRATALGMLARGETITLPEGVEPRRRQVVLHLHLTHAALTSTGPRNRCGSGSGSGGNAGNPPAAAADELIGMLHSHTGYPLGPVTADQIRHWCGSTSTTHITVKPLLDLAETLHSTGYQPSDRVRDHVTATNPTCAFPYCDRPSLKLDIDHIEPYDHGAGKDGIKHTDKDDGTGGTRRTGTDRPHSPDHADAQTSTDNLAPLCRRHHRAKTFGHWNYVRLSPGEYLWTSRHRYQWITDTDGTRAVTTRGRSEQPSAPPPEPSG